MKTRKKAKGLYVTLCACVLAIVTSVCYGVLFQSIQYKEPVFNIKICIILVAVAVIAGGLLFVNATTASVAPVILCLGSAISLLMFVKMVIWPVTDTIYGIEPFAQFNQLVICAVLLITTLVLSEVALYMKKDHTI